MKTIGLPPMLAVADETRSLTLVRTPSLRGGVAERVRVRVPSKAAEISRLVPAGSRIEKRPAESVPTVVILDVLSGP
jgi:hypothetical protein